MLEAQLTSSGNRNVFGTGRVNSPHIQSLSKKKVVVEVSDGTVHCIAVSHFHHGRPRLTLHELHL